LSLEEAVKLRDADGRSLPILVFLHFPPVWNGFVCREIVDLLHEYEISVCYFGHIHGAYYTPRSSVFEGIEFVLTAADALNFSPMPIYPTDF
jgi:predicted phosphohydrolase